MRIEDNLNNIFDIETVKDVPSQALVVLEPTEIIKASTNTAVEKGNENVEKDIAKAREVHYDLLEKSSTALNEMADFAHNSESPRAYEVLTNLIQTTSEVAKTLVDLSNSIPKKETSVTEKNTQNNIFLGSTAELQKLLKGNLGIDESH